MSLSAGTRLGPHEIVAPLGAGGMGDVYRARDTRLAREVAAKVLLERPARHPKQPPGFETIELPESGRTHGNSVLISYEEVKRWVASFPRTGREGSHNV